jgi:DNA-directed RNA polymerase subunit M/transcription elongation factor TFIIS
MASEINADGHYDDGLRYVFTVLVRCPACGSESYRVYGHRPKAESKTQYARCNRCEHKFLIVHEDSFNHVE